MLGLHCIGVTDDRMRQAMSVQDVRTLCAQFRGWSEGEDTTWKVPPMLAPLGLVRAHSVRRRCMALAWEALA